MYVFIYFFMNDIQNHLNVAYHFIMPASHNYVCTFIEEKRPSLVCLYPLDFYKSLTLFYFYSLHFFFFKSRIDLSIRLFGRRLKKKHPLLTFKPILAEYKDCSHGETLEILLSILGAIR